MRPLVGANLTSSCHTAVEAADGCIYGIPTQNNTVLRFDPRTNKLTTFGHIEDNALLKNYAPGTLLDACGRELKYITGVLGPSGRYIFCPPGMASRTLCIDTHDSKVELIGEDFGTYRGHVFDLLKYVTCALGGDNCIYAVPSSSQINHIFRIDPVTKTTSFFAFLPNKVDQFVKTWGASTGMDGCIYVTPHAIEDVIRIDPFAGTLSVIGVVPSNLRAKLTHSVVDRDGAIWLLPGNTPSGIVRLGPRPPQTALLTTLLQPQHRVILCEGLRDLQCYGPALAVALWRETARVGGDKAMVCGLLEAAAAVLPAVVTASIKQNNGKTAYMLMRTILAMLPPQVHALAPS